MTPRLASRAILGLSAVSLVLIQWGILDFAFHLPNHNFYVVTVVAGLLSLCSLLYYVPALITRPEFKSGRHIDGRIWREIPRAIYGALVCAVGYPLLFGRFGMAFVGIIAAAFIPYGCWLRLRLENPYPTEKTAA